MGIRVIYRLNQGDNKKCRSSEEQQSEWAGSPHDPRNPLNVRFVVDTLLNTSSNSTVHLSLDCPRVLRKVRWRQDGRTHQMNHYYYKWLGETKTVP